MPDTKAVASQVRVQELDRVGKLSAKERRELLRRWFNRELHKGTRTEYMFHPDREWKFDFAWPDLRVAVELEGHNVHRKSSAYRNDREKFNAAQSLGWMVFRFDYAELQRGVVYYFMKQIFEREVLM